MDTADFGIDERMSRDTRVIAVRGRIGLAEAWALEGRLLAAFDRTDRLVVDLSQVDEVSGGLVGALLRTRRHIAPDRGVLTLVVTGPPVSTIVSTSVLHELIGVAPDLAGAIDLLDGKRLPAKSTDGRFERGPRVA